jgi:hypothetical protein
MGAAVDGFGAASARAMAAHLTPPLAAGAAQRLLTPDADARLAVGFPARRPLLMLALRQDLDERPLLVTGLLEGGDPLPPLAFAGWSEAGTGLPLYRPAGERAVPFAITLGVSLGGVALPPAAAADWIEGLLSEGELGRLIALLGAEKGRLRREARQLQAMRRLDHAELDALDRLGADLGVPRLDGTPAWDAARREIVALRGPEEDASYRRRLGIYRPFMAPTRAAATALLRQGVPQADLLEPGNPLAVAVRLVAIGPAAPRAEMLARLRTDWLVQPLDEPGANAAHAARYLPGPRRSALEEQRARLRTAFAFPPGAALAPGLAGAMDRAAKILLAIGHPAPIAVTRAQDDAGGSRFETALGVAVTPLEPAAADALAARLDGPLADGTGRETAALVAAARATPPPAGDTTLEWLWRAAGMRTLHRLSTTALYLSDMPVRGLVIDGPDNMAPGIATEFRAVFEAAGDPLLNEALGTALATAAAGRVAAGAPDYTVLDEAAAAAARATAFDPPPASGVANTLAGAGLAVPPQAAPAVASLAAMPGELHRTLLLDAALSAQIMAADPAAIPPLAALVGLLKASGVVSLLPLASPGGLLLVAGVAALPVVGVNLGERRATGIRWGVVPLGGSATIARQGTRTSLTGQPGLVALVALGHVRDGSPDPYEIRCTLPEGSLLDLAQYEWLMNALERCFAMGVEVNTWSLRQAHVDLEGDGTADPLPPGLARHYRRFRMPRRRGLDEPE